MSLLAKLLAGILDAAIAVVRPRTVALREPIAITCDAGWLEQPVATEHKKHHSGMGIFIPELSAGIALRCNAATSNDAEVLAALLSARIAWYLGRRGEIRTDCLGAISWLTKPASENVMRKNANKHGAKEAKRIDQFRRELIQRMKDSQAVMSWTQDVHVCHKLGDFAMKKRSEIRFFSKSQKTFTSTGLPKEVHIVHFENVDAVAQAVVDTVSRKAALKPSTAPKKVVKPKSIRRIR